MTNHTTEKTAAAGATATTVNESDYHSNTDHSSLIFAHLPQRPIAGRIIDTWGGHDLERAEYMAVYIRRDELSSVVRIPGHVKVCMECVAARDEEARREEREKAEQRRRAQENAARFQQELDVIKDITGMDLSREDLPLIMLEYRRAGKDFQRFLDALEAIDDLGLKRAGLTSWDWGEEGDES